MRLNLLRILLAAMISLPSVGHAAQPLGPPIAEFFKKNNRIACGVAVEKPTSNKIAMRISNYLYLGDDETVTLTVDADVFTDVKVGKEYVFVFSRMRKNLLLRDEWEVNPEGPALVKARGLETPAIYTCNAAIITLLTPPGRRDVLSADAETSMLLSLAEDTREGRARELAIFELFLRGDLQSSMSGDNSNRYASLTLSAGPRLKNFLLQGARSFPEERRTPWLGREFRHVITAHGTELELNSDVPLLIKNSLLGLRDEGTVDDLEIIDKHLYSNAPGVARAALAALDAIDPDQALVRARHAVQTERIHLVARRALTAYIKEHTGP